MQERLQFQSGSHTLCMEVLHPEIGLFPGPRPTVVYWFGGGFWAGDRAQFLYQAKALAALGYRCFLPDYRVHSRHGTTPAEALADAQAAWRFVHQNAAALEADTRHIFACGGSAGGYLAFMACAGTGLQPRAYVLLNPVVDEIPVVRTRFQAFSFGQSLPIHQLSTNTASVHILHGTEDTTVPPAMITEFAQHAHGLGVACEVLWYQGQKHGFFNPNRHNMAPFKQALEDIIALLAHYTREEEAP